MSSPYNANSMYVFSAHFSTGHLVFSNELPCSSLGKSTSYALSITELPVIYSLEFRPCQPTTFHIIFPISFFFFQIMFRQQFCSFMKPTIPTLNSPHILIIRFLQSDTCCSLALILEVQGISLLHCTTLIKPYKLIPKSYEPYKRIL